MDGRKATSLMLPNSQILYCASLRCIYWTCVNTNVLLGGVLDRNRNGSKEYFKRANALFRRMCSLLVEMWKEIYRHNRNG